LINTKTINTVLHKIAFQYYPLDLNATSNPFLISWWPLALGDPALFHVSLQTACLDEELLAQKGFQSSEILMADSVTLLRSKIDDMTLAVQDGTMNSVITLATIEVRCPRLPPYHTQLMSLSLVWQRKHRNQRNACEWSSKIGEYERRHQFSATN
jgi:hypothetical protein